MGLLFLVVTIWSILLVTFAMCFDDRRPMSTELKYKYRVKDDSIFRKIIKFKDKEHCPCNYFKIVPFYIFLFIAILSLILLFIDIFANGFITNVVPQKVFMIIIICILGISILYFLIVVIWWEIVDYNELKVTNKEMEALNQLRKFRKNKK